jgi:ElaB/YqjD/DUF883 family membrane-anchored ribosome-binding protein
MESEDRHMKSISSATGHALRAATDLKEAGVEKAQEIVNAANTSVHRNPWPYIAGAAVAGLLAGCLVSRMCRSHPERGAPCDQE